MNGRQPFAAMDVAAGWQARTIPLVDPEHPLMLRAIAAAKKKNDRVDASKIADCLRCDFLPECHMASTEIRDRRRTLGYRCLLVRQMVQTKNRISGLLMETGVAYNEQQLHKVGYFRELLASNEEVNESNRPLLRLSRDTIAAGDSRVMSATINVTHRQMRGAKSNASFKEQRM